MKSNKNRQDINWERIDQIDKMSERELDKNLDQADKEGKRWKRP